jgi:transcriptional regulator with PAS, ATPase and Fis domain
MPLVQDAQQVQAYQPFSQTPDVAQFPEGSTAFALARRLLAQTPSLFPLVERLALAADHDVTLLLTGETGSGKTSLARLIHDCSPRRQEPFVAVPCGALSPDLIESELFGHVRGAFTGAERTKIGKFAAAAHGTLLLDEIDALGLDKQANLLRVLESGEYEPVGSNCTQRTACRIVAASNVSLEELVEQGRFRRDLYYRLKVLSFHLPPLRERPEDIAPLTRALLARFRDRFHKDVRAVSPEALSALEAYPWPGNLRELENVVQEAVLVSRGPVLLVPHLPDVLRKQRRTATAVLGPPGTFASVLARCMSGA